MGKLKLDDFKKYVKEEYNCDISTKESANPDTFDNIFNGNFINTDLMVVEHTPNLKIRRFTYALYSV